MGWIQKLYETYDNCAGLATLESRSALTPLSHAVQQAHIEVALDASGNFRRARVIPKEDTVIPVTENSATTRTSGIRPHALCDHLKYCAGDYREVGETGNAYFDAYQAKLEEWCASPHAHPKAIAVFRYVRKKSLVHDLVAEGVLPLDKDGQILRRLGPGMEKPPLFKQVARDPKTAEYKPQNALIRWIVESGADLVPEVWKDTSLQAAWLEYADSQSATRGLCMVTGVERILATKHPKGLRGGRDGAKLISWKKEEDSGFTYLGRFLDARQVLSVGREVSEKAHHALRWLIKRQGYQDGGQAIVAWTVAGKPVPDPFHDTRSLFLADELSLEQSAARQENPERIVGDVGQAFALRLNKAIAGYRARFHQTDDIIVMALDSATPGRVAITFYRELTGSEFLDRVRAWHEAYAWHQDYGKDAATKKPVRFVGAPSPRDVAYAAFGSRLDDKLRKATVERLLPCIIDGRPLPRDLVESTVRRACNRAGLTHWEWEKGLGIACALFRGFFKERKYQMTLETERTSRDYLYGRLLAIAEHIEGMALYVAGEGRDTNAARLMQRFADRPASTWRTLALALGPYKTRLRSRRAGFLVNMEKLLDEVTDLFSGDSFVDDRKLSGEFLLGYHCQRQDLHRRKELHSSTEEESTTTATTETTV